MARRNTNGPKKRVAHTFDSLAAFIAYGDKPYPIRSATEKETRSSHEESEFRTEWTGSESYADARRLAFGGWREGADRIAKRRAAITKALESTIEEVTLKKRGPGALNPARFLSGHPKPYLGLDEIEGPSPVVHLIVSGSVSAAVPADMVERRGAAICALVDALERNRKTVRVDMANVQKGESHLVSYVTTIKKAGAKLNLPTVAFALAHPSMFRRIGFAAIEQETGAVWRDLSDGYGFPANLPTDEIPTGALYLPTEVGISQDWLTDESAADWVKRTAAGFGVILN